METILDRILTEKKSEVAELKKYPVPNEKSFVRNSFLQVLEERKEISIIAEFKRASPSKGDINLHREPISQTSMYANAGASAISVLTDRTFFKGSMADLEAVRSAVTLPLLCKDFIIDPVQIDLAAGNGADIILLIAAALEQDELVYLHQYARSKGLEVLMEIHNEEEAERVLKTGNRLIGVNNRNLKTFEVSLETTIRLAPLIKKQGCFLISESGIATTADVRKVAEAGADGILVGEAFMRQGNPAAVIEQMKLPLEGRYQR